MNNQKRNIALLKIRFDKIHQDHPDIRDSTNKFVWTFVRNKTSTLSRHSIHLILYLPINQPLASAYFSNNKAFDKFLGYSIHSKSTDNSLESLSTVIMNGFFVHFWISFVKW